MNQRNLLAELNGAIVYKVATAYEVVAWLLIQIATQVFPFLNLRNREARLAVLLLAIGFLSFEALREYGA